VTLGRTAKGANLVASPALLAAQGVELFEVERGGDITFHGPGQLVGYPILDLKRHRQDLHWYLRQVEEALIGTIGEFGLLGSRVEKYTGVWVSETGTGNRRAPAEGGQIGTESLYRDDEDPSLALGMTTMTCDSEPRVPAKRADEESSSSRARGTVPRSPLPVPIVPSRRKIASIGVHARDWVTWHGFALNVNTDLRYFDLIVPCGITGVTMTSVARELDVGSVVMREVADAVVRAFGDVFGLATRSVSRESLGADVSWHLAHTTT
jgi:lipoyl(octanoyl) transferase